MGGSQGKRQERALIKGPYVAEMQVTRSGQIYSAPTGLMMLMNNGNGNGQGLLGRFSGGKWLKTTSCLLNRGPPALQVFLSRHAAQAVRRGRGRGVYPERISARR
jgi:hypothetical protein